MHDFECYKLAIRYLTDEPMNDTIHAEKYRQALSSHIQSEIKSWLESERYRFECGKDQPLHRFSNEADRLRGIMKEAKILIGAQNDNATSAIKEENLNKAWHLLNDQP